MMRRRMGAPLLRTAVVAGGAYAVGSSAAKNAAREQEQSAQIAELQAQQEQMAQQQQMMTQQQAPQQPEYAPPPQPQYAPPAPEPTPAPPPAAPAAAAPSQSDRLAQLKQLGELKAAGILTDAEFEAEKAKILNS